jgi:diphosphomevalonate decarboxylase
VTRSWLHFRDTFEVLIVNNTALSSVQIFHYLIASLKNEAKDLISNLQMTNENFLVAWQLVTQRYNNKRLIAMMHAKHLCQVPQVKKRDAPSLRQLINHVSSHMNALQALSLNVPVQDLMMNHLMLPSLDRETQREWELITSPRADTPTTAELITFLKSRCRALELLQTTQSPRSVTAPSRPSASTGHKVSKHSYSIVATRVQCTLCNESHRLFKCDKFIKMQRKQQIPLQVQNVDEDDFSGSDEDFLGFYDE